MSNRCSLKIRTTFTAQSIYAIPRSQPILFKITFHNCNLSGNHKLGDNITSHKEIKRKEHVINSIPNGSSTMERSIHKYGVKNTKDIYRERIEKCDLGYRDNAIREVSITKFEKITKYPKCNAKHSERTWDICICICKCLLKFC